MKITIRALTVLLILCGAALLVLSLRPARIEKIPQAPAPSAESQNSAGTGQGLGQFTVLSAPLPAPALVNFWATWCGPCREEMPSLDRLQAKLGDKLAILAISEDRQGETVVAPFLQKNGIQHLAIFLDPKAAATNAFSAQGLPSSYLIARDGTIVGKEEGGAAWDDPAMLAKLQPYLDAK